MEKPLFIQLAELVSPYTCISGVNTDEETYFFLIPPFGRLSPPTDNSKNSIEALSPYEGSYRRVPISLDFDRFAN